MLTARILAAAPLPMPSASGIEIVGAVAYVISDDAPFLYRFRAADLAPLEPLRLFETPHFATGRIPKKRKPDLEALTFLPPLPRDPSSLLLAGSGATAAREQGFWVNFGYSMLDGVSVYPASFSVLYRVLRLHLPAGQPLNIEAMAATTEHLWLFHRPVGTVAGRLAFRLTQADADASLRPPHRPPVTLRAYPYRVPDLDGQFGGLSGATFFDEKLFVTASVEATTDPVLDGEVLGSFVGLLNPKKPSEGQFVQLAWPDGRPFREKVEGIAVRARTTAGYELLLVTDDDRGGSTVLVVEGGGGVRHRKSPRTLVQSFPAHVDFPATQVSGCPTHMDRPSASGPRCPAPLDCARTIGPDCPVPVDCPGGLSTWRRAVPDCPSTPGTFYYF